MARGKRPIGGGAVSAVAEPRQRQAPTAPREGPDALAALVVDLVHLAGGRVASAAFEPVALLLMRAGVVDGEGVTFGCDYDLNIRSRELRRGFVRAIDCGKLVANSDEMWLGVESSGRPDADREALLLARELFALPRPELERRARRQLLAE
jgi:hypothetical protein